MYCSSCTLSSSKRRQRQSSVSNEVGDEVMSPSCRSRVELAPPYSRDPNNNVETVMRKLLAALALVVLALAAYLMLWPVPIQPAGWAAPKAPGYSGPHAVNTRLARLQTLSLG